MNAEKSHNNNHGKLGFTTGACAAAAAKAALCTLMGDGQIPETMEIPFPNGERHQLPIAFVRSATEGFEAGVVKDAGDDPDITHGALVISHVTWGEKGVELVAGEGVGTVTKKGLSVAPGEPAINPGPRQMIRAAVSELTEKPVKIEVSIPGGRQMAQQTYNPRLGIVNGLSVLGTTGRVRPFSCAAIQCSVACEMDVTREAGVKRPVLVPGHIGERSVRQHLALGPDQVIEVGNEWGFVLDRMAGYPFTHVLFWGHPGKLAKLADHQWDTHSSRSGPATRVIKKFMDSKGLWLDPMPPTAEGIFEALSGDARRELADTLCRAISEAATEKANCDTPPAVVLVNMAGKILGIYGKLSSWPKQ